MSWGGDPNYCLHSCQGADSSPSELQAKLAKGIQAATQISTEAAFISNTWGSSVQRGCVRRAHSEQKAGVLWEGSHVIIEGPCLRAAHSLCWQNGEGISLKRGQRAVMEMVTGRQSKHRTCFTRAFVPWEKEELEEKGRGREHGRVELPWHSLALSLYSLPPWERGIQVRRQQPLSLQSSATVWSIHAPWCQSAFIDSLLAYSRKVSSSNSSFLLHRNGSSSLSLCTEKLPCK